VDTLLKTAKLNVTLKKSMIVNMLNLLLQHVLYIQEYVELIKAKQKKVTLYTREYKAAIGQLQHLCTLTVFVIIRMI
jgi:hypothetical protein